ncbi:hypothetical protein K6327_002788 [Vibrio vulnificus]|nr:hypothetical protein [Vibrio vulnificus]
MADEIISSLRSELLETNNRVQVAENKTQLLEQENRHLRFVNKELSRKHGGLVELQ